jgi:hypothetical protein
MLRGCGLIFVISAVLAQAQTQTEMHGPASVGVGDVSIAAELKTTVKAENAHRGDPVEFRTLEAQLIANGVVMPANAKLTGRIVGAAPQQADKPSWLVLLVERAEWKEASIPLHAFIARQIAISVNQLNSQNTDGMTNSNARRVGRESARAAVHDGIDNSSSTRMPQDAKDVSPQGTGTKTQPIKDLRIVRDKDGIAYLFSANSNVKLPSGTLFVLQNQPPQSPAAQPPGAASDPKPAPVAPPQQFTSQQ